MTVADHTQAITAPRAISRWAGILATLGPLLGLVLVYSLFALAAPGSFSSAANVVTIVRQTTIVAIAALGMTLIIISGGIDLSVGSMIALITVVIAYALRAGLSPVLAACAGLASGMACGILNGTLISLLRVGPFIVTLGTLLAYRGIAKGMAAEQKIDADITVLNDLLSAAPGGLGPFPPGVWIAVVLSVMVAALSRYTRLGRHIVAVGSNELTARLCGISVARVKITVYALGGLLTGIAGLMQFSRLTVGDPTVAAGLELDVIAAVVIGGGSLAGGEGSVLGSIVGALIMTTIRSGGSQLGWPNWRQEIITGIIIVLAVALDRLRHRRYS